MPLDSPGRRAPRRSRLAIVAALGSLAAACSEPGVDSPDLVSVWPRGGEAGTRVWLNGWGFEPGATVRFGDLAADSVQFVNANTLAAYAPGELGLEEETVYDVAVRNPDGASDALIAAYVVARVPEQAPLIAGRPGSLPALEEVVSQLEAESSRDSDRRNPWHPSGARALLGRDRP